MKKMAMVVVIVAGMLMAMFGCGSETPSATANTLIIQSEETPTTTTAINEVQLPAVKRSPVLSLNTTTATEMPMVSFDGVISAETETSVIHVTVETDKEVSGFDFTMMYDPEYLVIVAINPPQGYADKFSEVSLFGGFFAANPNAGSNRMRIAGVKLEPFSGKIHICDIIVTAKKPGETTFIVQGDLGGDYDSNYKNGDFRSWYKISGNASILIQ